VYDDLFERTISPIAYDAEMVAMPTLSLEGVQFDYLSLAATIRLTVKASDPYSVI
jgi:hypothetical protein